MTALPSVGRRYARHWKERYEPGVPLIFLKRLRIEGDLVVKPGDPLSDELRARLGEHRLKVWWTARVIGSRAMALVLGYDLPPEKGPECGIKLGEEKPLPKPSKPPNFGGKPKR